MSQVLESNHLCQLGSGARAEEDGGVWEVPCEVAALKVLSGRLVPDQDLEALRASYFDSSLAAKESS